MSYFTPSGHYASSEYYFDSASYFPETQAIVPWNFETSEGDAQRSGVYRYGGGFPFDVWHASNYWVEPVFTTD